MSQSPSTSGANPPAHSIRKHGLKASVWRNETRNGPLYNVTLVRTFRDGEEFKDTTSLGFDDLANAAKLLLDAESWVSHQVTRDKAEEARQPPPTAATTPSPQSSRRRGRLGGPSPDE